MKDDYGSKVIWKHDKKNANKASTKAMDEVVDITNVSCLTISSKKVRTEKGPPLTLAVFDTVAVRNVRITNVEVKRLVRLSRNVSDSDIRHSIR